MLDILGGLAYSWAMGFMLVLGGLTAWRFASGRLFNREKPDEEEKT